MDNSRTGWETHSPTKARWFRRCLIVLLATTITINLISAFIRLSEAGTGCMPWPDCYAHVGRYLTAQPPSASATLAPVELIKQAHRATATLLVVIVLAVIGLARELPLGRSVRMLPYAIALVVLLLAVVGPASYLKTLPAVATANLAGGMALLALTWLLWLGTSAWGGPHYPTLRPWARTAVVVLILQLLLGAWVSANFAAAACTGFLTCSPDGAGLESFWYLRELSVQDTGRVLQDGSQALIQRTHQVWAMVTTLSLVWLGWRGSTLGGRARVWGSALLVLVVTQGILGIGSVSGSLPLWMVLSHNLLASLLLLAVLRLLVLSRDPTIGAPDRSAARSFPP